jgi:hypothetical protein
MSNTTTKEEVLEKLRIYHELNLAAFRALQQSLVLTKKYEYCSDYLSDLDNPYLIGIDETDIFYNGMDVSHTVSINSLLEGEEFFIKLEKELQEKAESKKLQYKKSVENKEKTELARLKAKYESNST